jgi:hypothetical protein
MVVGTAGGRNAHVYAGYRFDPTDLPTEFQPPERWRDYLFDHAVPGQIVSESAYVQRLLERTPAPGYLRKATQTTSSLDAVLPPKDEWRPHGWYSFNPDGPHPGLSPCYNCVKWAIETANRLVPGFLVPVRQGRIKLIVDQLKGR